MVRHALVQRRLGHLHELVHQRGKGLKFLRRMVGHPASILVPLLLIAGCISSEPPRPTTGPQRQAEQNSADEKGQTNRPSPSQTETAKGDTDADEPENGALKEHDPDWTAIVQAFASVVSAGLAFVIWRVYVGQLKAMREQSKHMSEGLTETRRQVGTPTRPPRRRANRSS